MARPKKIFDEVLKIKLRFLAKAILHLLNLLDIENDGFSSWLKDIYSKSDDLNFPDWTRYYEEKFYLTEIILILGELLFSDADLEVEEADLPLDLDEFYENFAEHAIKGSGLFLTTFA